MNLHPIHQHLIIHRNGDVYSTKTNKFLKTQINHNGYRVFSTRLNGRSGKTTVLRIHRLVADTYLSNPLNLPAVNHLDGDKLNNNLNNLEWCSNKENTIHARKLGLIPKFDRDTSKITKINNTQIKEIQSIYIPRNKYFGLRVLAKKYNISHSVLSRLVRRGEVESP